MKKEQLNRAIEALLYMTDHPLKLKELVEIFDLKTIQEDDIKAALQDLQQNLDETGSALTLVEAAGGIQMATRPEMAPYIRRLFKERLTARLSPSAMETLSIIAYKQPISKAEIEKIRGVEASGVVDTLIERGLIKVVGRKETIGRPRLYGTTPEFLRQFGLKHLSELPDLATLPTPQNEDLPSEEEQPDLNLDSNETAESQTDPAENPEESLEPVGAVAATSEDGVDPADASNEDEKSSPQ